MSRNAELLRSELRSVSVAVALSEPRCNEYIGYNQILSIRNRGMHRMAANRPGKRQSKKAAQPNKQTASTDTKQNRSTQTRHIDALEHVPERRILVALAAVGLALIVVYFSHLIFAEGRPNAPDIAAHRGLAAESASWRFAHDGQVPLWTPYILSGMPSYGSMIYAAGGALETLDKVVAFITGGNFGLRLSLYFGVGGVCLFALMRRYGRSHFAAFFAAVLYVFTPYFIGLINAGHNNKIWAAAVLPVVLLTTDILLKERSVRALAWFALATAWQLWCNHPQVTYYTMMFVGFLIVSDAVLLDTGIIDKIKRFAGDAVLIGAGTALALAAMALPYGPVLDYTPESVRGSKPSAVVAPGNTSAGESSLDRQWQFATGWSMHPKELITFMFPSFYGLWNNPEYAAEAQQAQFRAQQLQQTGQLSRQDIEDYYTSVAKAQSYWGYMGPTGSTGRFTQSTYYIGLLPLLLLPFIRPKRRGLVWGSLAFSLFALLLGLGQFFGILYLPAYKLLPYFAKFRVPSMIYMVLPLSVGIAAAWAADEISQQSPTKPGARKGSSEFGFLQKAMMGTAGVFTLFGVVALVAGLKIKYDPASVLDIPQGAPQEFISAIGSVRGGLILGDLTTALVLAVLFLGAVWLLHKGRLGPRTFLAVLIAATLFDLWRMDFVFVQATPPPITANSVVKPAAVDVLEAHVETSSDTLFRVAAVTGMNRAGGFNISTGLVEQNDLGMWSLPNVSGYQPAKLRIYDDLIISGGLNRRSVLNMLGTRYLIGPAGLNAPGLQILGPEPERNSTGHVAYLNTQALPRAWWVSDVRSVSDATTALNTVLSPRFSPEREAVVMNGQTRQYQVPSTPPRVTEFDFHRIAATVTAQDTAFLVFSEVFYKHWHVTVSGVEAPIYQTNYVLRGIKVPPGTHDIVMEYQSPAYDLSYYGSRVVLVVLFLVLAVEETRRYLNRRKESSQ